MFVGEQKSYNLCQVFEKIKNILSVLENTKDDSWNST